MPGEIFEGPRGGSEMYLSNLPSQRFYNIIKKEYPDLSDYSQKCDTTSVQYHKNEAKQICEKILRYLDKYAAFIDDKNEYDVCILLNYWIYDALTDIFGPENISKKFNLAFSDLQMMWNYPSIELKKTSYYNKCKPKFEIFNHEDWEKRRELYEYYVDYKTIFHTAKSYDNVCREYYEKIKQKKHLFEYFDGLCDSKPDQCPDFYENSKNYNPKSVLPTLSCPVPTVSTKNYLSAQADSEQGLVDGPRPYDTDFSGHRAHSSKAGMTQENSDIGTKVGKSVLGIAPVALTASALYRFTPLGQWIRKLGGSNHNITGNGFGDEVQESGNMFFDGGENYISYQPM
ncbi:PIR Superfamily Protein [Plasmodium ovale wallikeri]|uniref:PIR Superfamily Protein n=2 Tax=Plasmodium ovale TaxID=36330 RepID=A0A1A8YHB3_PLAOA|nr:PIR Superfamily Protein [Plasmodium ovale wallikeri]SBT31542.1 PIR Superfamily Protein [Plasmodium ovale wallikeri]SBT74238.1 PIR protein [Plasmodium ovale]